MTLSEIFFGRVEMPARMSREVLAQGVSEIRETIAIERARQAEEARREEERRREAPEERNPYIMYHTRFVVTPDLESVGIGCPPTRKRPPNLKASKLSFAAQLLMFVQTKCGGRGVVAYKRAGVRRNVYSRIVSDDRSRADKRTVLQFCVGLQLCRAEADLLLKGAGYALSETLDEDIAFAYCIDHAIWNLEDINLILSRCGLETICLPEERGR